MDRTKKLLKQYWGYTGFRPLQEEAIRCVLGDRDSLVVLPTGGGKSLCFQLPALATDGMALVVSPLISLMKDQVDFLRSCGVEAACIHSGITGAERIEVHDAIREARLKILYVAPERLLTQDFVSYIRNLEISFIAIDEAHCISHWGHDFRPSYRELASLKELFPDKALHAYTATATQQVRDDICAQLSLKSPEVLVGDFDRPNLQYSAEPQRNAFEKITTIIDRHKGESGIVYAISRKGVDALADKLTDAGYAALPYHAGMNEVARKRNQEAFAREETDIMVATVAFGMGIDKSNVRYVIHAGMPKSLEHYQQESGRAGRDGLEAECHLLYSKRDYVQWKRMLADLDDDAYAVAVDKLNDMNAYAAGARCRHRALVEYFGQAFKKDKCGACDICLNTARVIENPEIVAGNILAAVDALGSIAGPTYTVEVLRGSNEARILERGHHELETWGALKQYRKQDVRDWVEQLVGQGYLTKEGEFNILRTTDKAELLIQGAEKPMLLEPEAKTARSRKPAMKKTWEGVDKDLFELLRQKRLELAKARSVAAFVIFGDRALREMASKLPKDEMEFLQISGVGEKKCAEFGREFLDIIRDYADNSVVPEAGAEANPAPTKRGQAKAEAFALFAEGWSVGEVAARLSRTKSTATQYLSDYISDQQLDSAHPWVSDETLARVQAAVGVLGAGRIKPIHEHLDGDVSYEEIQVALACIRNLGETG